MNIIWITILILCSFLVDGFGESDANKYTAIVQRNAFNLREPEPPKPPEAPPPSVSVKLTGITTLLNTKRVFLQVQEQGKQPESKMLQEGDKDGPIEVVQIDEANGNVKIINSGKEQTLNFEKDGIKPPTAPATPMPPQPGMAIPGAIPLPGAVNPNMPRQITPGTTPPGLPTTINVPPMPSATINPSTLPGSTMSGTSPQSSESTTTITPSNPKQVRLPGSKPKK